MKVPVTLVNVFERQFCGAEGNAVRTIGAARRVE